MAYICRSELFVSYFHWQLFGKCRTQTLDTLGGKVKRRGPFSGHFPAKSSAQMHFIIKLALSLFRFSFKLYCTPRRAFSPGKWEMAG